MEDILSSIKKIIADDSSRPAPSRVTPKVEPEGRAARPAIAAVAAPEPEDVLELAAESEAEAEDLVSDETLNASRSALESLNKVSVAPEAIGGMTVEALARELLRPMLKDWLDSNLPDIVQTAVAHEVARITGRKN